MSYLWMDSKQQANKRIIMDLLEFSKYSPVSLIEFLIVTFLTTLLSFITVKIYTWSMPNPIKRKEEHELILLTVLMGVIASLVSLVVGANLAKAFAIFGVLSIVRFRAAMGKEHTVAFIFMAVSLGICCGSRYYTLAILYTIFLSIIIFFVNVFFGKFKQEEIKESGASGASGKARRSKREEKIEINET